MVYKHKSFFDNLQFKIETFASYGMDLSISMRGLCALIRANFIEGSMPIFCLVASVQPCIDRWFFRASSEASLECESQAEFVPYPLSVSSRLSRDETRGSRSRSEHFSLIFAL